MKAYPVVINLFIGILFLPKYYTLELRVPLSEDVCRYFKNGEIVRNPSSCTETLICQDGKSTPYSKKCNGDKIILLSTMDCGKANKADSYCTPACDKKSPKWIADNKNCREWHECKNGTIGQTGFCPVGQIFNQTEQRCNYDNGKCDKTFDICNVAKTSVSFWDENNCHKYFVCDTKGNLQNKTCTLGHYYEARNGICTEKAKVNCYKHPIPDYVCGNEKLAVLNAFVKDQATCRGFFYCKSLPRKNETDGSWNYNPDKNPTWGQCQKNLFFDEETQYCRDQNYVKCNEDRCDGHMSGKVLSEKPGCKHYLECINGYTHKEVPCDNNKYFDPVTETCVYTKITYPICE